MDWKAEYEKKFITAEKAASFVKSGDFIAFTVGREAYAIGLAIAARKDELKNVRVSVPTPGYDFGWYDEGWQDSFDVVSDMATGVAQEALEARLIDFMPSSFILWQGALIRPADVLLAEVSDPDAHGFCSFGQSLWNKKREIRAAKLVIAEVNKNLIRTYGDNFIHVSEMDYFVEHRTSGSAPGMGSLGGRAVKEPEPHLKPIAEFVSGLIKDRDNLQIGIGRTTEPLVKLGILDNRQDIGYHSEATPPGIISLVRNGVITGKYKNINPDKVIVTSLGGGTREEMEWAAENPAFHLVDVEYLEDPRVISAHDNFFSLNNALAVDLYGQTTSETLGTRILGGSGGQPAFVAATWLSRGGRSVIVLPSTAEKGKASRIMPSLPLGTAITIPRNMVDTVITEYGIARLKGKSNRERAEALIAIAHPDFREELRREARKRYWK